MTRTRPLALAAVLALTASLAMALPASEFLAYGTAAGDSLMYRNDDGSSSEISLATPIRFFGTDYSSLWVNNNGNFTFDGDMYTYTPFAFPGSRVIVSAYFADVDTRPSDGGYVYYGDRTDAASMTYVNDIVHASGISNAGLFDAAYAYVGTWDAVGYYGYHTDLLNTFQQILATDGLGNTYAIFNYLDDGMWRETGDASYGSGGYGGYQAVAGFDAGDNVNAYMIPGSRQHGISKVLETGSNVGVAGQYVFRISQAYIEPPPDSTYIPEPTTLALLGIGLAGLAGYSRKRR